MGFNLYIVFLRERDFLKLIRFLEFFETFFNLGNDKIFKYLPHGMQETNWPKIFEIGIGFISFWNWDDY